MNQPTSKHLRIAIASHEANKMWHNVNGLLSTDGWEKMQEWEKEDEAVKVMVAEANPDQTASEAHAAWMNKKIEDGWVLGDVKDSVAKTHPSLVSFSDLPPYKAKNRTVIFGVMRVLLQD